MHDQPYIEYEQPGAREIQRQAQARWYAILAGQLVIAFVVFIASVVLCAVGGGLLGKLTAVCCPHYYPSVFPTAATQPDFDAAEMGIGLGVGQGACAGLFVGAVIVLALAIANWRRLRPERS